MSYPIATKLDIGFDCLEDRLVIVARTRDHGYRGLWLTRRLTGGLLQRFAQELHRSSPHAAKAAPGFRDEVLRMEHLGAISKSPSGASTGGSTTDKPSGEPPGDTAWFLVPAVHLRWQEQLLVVTFDGLKRGDHHRRREAVVAIALDRGQAHQVLSLLSRKAQEAQWNLPRASAWIDNLSDQTDAVMT